VGPATVSGPGVVEADLVSVALEAIDDRLAVHGDRVVAVREVWGEVMRAALAGEQRSAVLIVPSWWPRSRAELVEHAMLDSCAQVTVLARACVSRTGASHVVEFGPELVVVHAAAGNRIVLPLAGRSSRVADEVVEILPAGASLVIDVPDGMRECTAVASEVARRMRARGVAATSLGDDGLRRAVLDSRRTHLVGVHTPRVAVLVGALAVIAALAGAALTSGDEALASDDVTWVVEGRVAVELPAKWPVERVTSGPGSARVQVVSPNEPRVAIHVTQAGVRVEETLQDTAETLKVALDDQPHGLFVDFNPADRRAGRPAVTYRELRAAIGVDWVVMLDRGLRIAVGCQHVVDRPSPDPACERAVRTAHALP
jgi:type VII secretion-associated protein (TIGR03931 family)